MQDLKKIETVVLHTMMAAYLSYYGRVLSMSEAADCKTTLRRIEDEITSRKDSEEKLLLPASYCPPVIMNFKGR
jgi:hypothetical protein